MKINQLVHYSRIVSITKKTRLALLKRQVGLLPAWRFFVLVNTSNYQMYSSDVPDWIGVKRSQVARVRMVSLLK